MYTHITLFKPRVWAHLSDNSRKASLIMLLEITRIVLNSTDVCGRFWVSSLKFPLSVLPHCVPSCQMFKMYTSTSKPCTVCCCSCRYIRKYLCGALVCMPAVRLSSPWQASQALFVIISFFLSKGTVPLKTGASRPLRASRKGIGIGVNEPFIHYYYFTHFAFIWPQRSTRQEVD